MIKKQMNDFISAVITGKDKWCPTILQIDRKDLIEAEAIPYYVAQDECTREVPLNINVYGEKEH